MWKVATYSRECVWEERRGSARDAYPHINMATVDTCSTTGLSCCGRETSPPWTPPLRVMRSSDCARRPRAYSTVPTGTRLGRQRVVSRSPPADSSSSDEAPMLVRIQDGTDLREPASGHATRLINPPTDFVAHLICSPEFSGKRHRAWRERHSSRSTSPWGVSLPCDPPANAPTTSWFAAAAACLAAFPRGRTASNNRRGGTAWTNNPVESDRRRMSSALCGSTSASKSIVGGIFGGV